MRKTFRFRKVLVSQLVLAVLILWLAQGMLTELGEIAYAGAQAAQKPADANRKAILIERPPARFIKDPNPGFSTVAVNSDHNMLVVGDENLFQILEYDHRDNTPPQARFTEPKRVISGTNTFFEMMCGVYIDPKTREIYVINGDTQNWMPVFTPDARGNAKPSRLLEVPGHPFQMAVHEEREEIFMTIQSDNSIDVYRKQASGQEKPLRTIQGGDTQLEDPHGIALDTKNNLMFVSNFGNVRVRAEGSRTTYGRFEAPSITVYPLLATGNSKPVRVIEGPATMLNWPAHMVLHEERQELFVANDADDSILVFRATDHGNTAPIRVIKGPKTRIKNPPGIALDVKLGELYVANMGNSSVTVFPATANGDVAPLRTVRGAAMGTANLMIGNPGAVGYDSKREQILVPN
jgi:DNA-binding beta-propeller fold protein YncE